MKPFVKWAGGKRQILDRINEFLMDSKDDSNYTYIEPFLGGGAVFFNKKPKKAIISDLNEDLINAYLVIKSERYTELIDKLNEHAKNYNLDRDGYYYDIRNIDRTENWKNNYNDVDRAARMIFLNRTCYNGLYRVNSKGEFNTPIGRYKNPLICDKDNITEIHNYLSSNENKIEIYSCSYEKSIQKAKEGDIVYIDPPYDYEDDDGFTKYQIEGFTFKDFENLKKECDKAIENNAKIIISNNATKKVINLFENDPRYKIYYEKEIFTTLRNINCKGDKRRTGTEIIIWGDKITYPQANDIEKVIKLLMAGDEVINDKEKSMKLLNVSTYRQVLYYRNALMFFGFLKRDKHLTKTGEENYHDRKNIEQIIFDKLLGDKIFSTVYEEFKYNKNVKIDFIVDCLKKENNKLSNETIKRRSSTIKNWIEWMYERF